MPTRRWCVATSYIAISPVVPRQISRSRVLSLRLKRLNLWQYGQHLMNLLDILFGAGEGIACTVPPWQMSSDIPLNPQLFLLGRWESLRGIHNAVHWASDRRISGGVVGPLGVAEQRWSAAAPKIDAHKKCAR